MYRVPGIVLLGLGMYIAVRGLSATGFHFLFRAAVVILGLAILVYGFVLMSSAVMV
jgi:hypothetical protein